MEEGGWRREDGGGAWHAIRIGMISYCVETAAGGCLVAGGWWRALWTSLVACGCRTSTCGAPSPPDVGWALVK
jgi:hypothetical protein